MMKNLRKALLGIVVIGGLMFVGCSNQDIPEGSRQLFPVPVEFLLQ